MEDKKERKDHFSDSQAGLARVSRKRVPLVLEAETRGWCGGGRRVGGWVAGWLWEICAISLEWGQKTLCFL